MMRFLALFALALAVGWTGIASSQVHYGPNARPELGVVGKRGTGPVYGPAAQPPVTAPDPAVSLNPPARTPGPGTPIYNAIDRHALEAVPALATWGTSPPPGPDRWVACTT